ncbi:MAG: class I SAM-dependent methyltransferase [bacterium]|nr:SAM-dependent methyltransferase [Gammaproteobacteria bacterium]HIL97261.1 SAM-dependent methyltransferase [Pseudomonadales bacterium]
MSSKSIEQRHSETALFATICRAVAALDAKSETKDFLAINFLPAKVRFFIKFDWVRKNFKAKNQKMTPGAYEYLIARTAYFDERFKAGLKNVPQIVLLGSGYDTRTYRFANLNNSTKIYELDAPTTQERKLKHLHKAKIDVPDNVTMIPINFNKGSIVEALKNQGYNDATSTLILWEGVSMYLEPKAVEAILDFVSGSDKNTIVFDYITTVTEDNIDSLYGVKDFMETWIKHREGEPFRFSVEEQTIERLLNQHGLKLIDSMDSIDMHNAYLSKEHDQITGFFRFAVAATPPASKS